MEWLRKAKNLSVDGHHPDREMDPGLTQHDAEAFTATVTQKKKNKKDGNRRILIFKGYHGVSKVVGLLKSAERSLGPRQCHIRILMYIISCNYNCPVHFYRLEVAIIHTPEVAVTTTLYPFPVGANENTTWYLCNQRRLPWRHTSDGSADKLEASMRVTLQVPVTLPFRVIFRLYFKHFRSVSCSLFLALFIFFPCSFLKEILSEERPIFMRDLRFSRQVAHFRASSTRTLLSLVHQVALKKGHQPLRLPIGPDVTVFPHIVLSYI